MDIASLAPRPLLRVFDIVTNRAASTGICYTGDAGGEQGSGRCDGGASASAHAVSVLHLFLGRVRRVEGRDVDGDEKTPAFSCPPGAGQNELWSSASLRCVILDPAAGRGRGKEPSPSPSSIRVSSSGPAQRIQLACIAVSWTQEGETSGSPFLLSLGHRLRFSGLHSIHPPQRTFCANLLPISYHPHPLARHARR